MNSQLQRILNTPYDGSDRDFANLYVRTNCSNPRKMFFYDKHTRQRREMFVSCGKCPTCRDRHVGGWLSRMCLHTQYCRKYVYFVTLTYRSFNHYDDIPAPLLDAYWRLDDLNSSSRFCYSPCLIRYEHVQRFLKYLRKQLPPSSLDFFCGSELGEDFGRPHHHLVLWSDVPLNIMMLYRAWSLNISTSRKYSSTCAIGHIDFYDFQTGAITSDLCKVFRYVAKYCSKNFLQSDYLSKSRSRFLHSDLLSLCQNPTLFNTIFTRRITNKYLTLYAKHIANVCRKVEIDDYNAACLELHGKLDPAFPYYTKFVELIKTLNPYEKENQSPDTSYLFIKYEDYFSDDEFRTILVDFYLSLSEAVLLQPFIPRCCSSRHNAIGKKYLISNLDKYKGTYRKLPKTLNSSLLFPRYFEKLIQKNMERYTLVLPALAQKCPKVLSCIDKVQFAPIVAQIQYIDLLTHSNVPIYSAYDGCRDSLTISEYLRQKPYIYDYHTGCRVIAYIDCDGHVSFRSYLCKRNSTILVNTESIESFLDNLQLSVESYSSYYENRLLDLSSSVSDLQFLIDSMPNFYDLLAQSEMDYVQFRDNLIASRKYLKKHFRE